MPSRVIRGEINSSESLSRVSPEAELTFRALLTAVDDYGRLDARAEILKAQLFPMRAAFTPSKILGWVRELDAEGCVRLYYGPDGRPYLQLTGWEKHRGTSKRAKESKYPEFQESGNSPEIPGDPSESRESGVGNRESRVESRGESARGGPAARAAATPPVGFELRSDPEPKPKRASKQPKTSAPERLTDEQRGSLAVWCATDTDTWAARPDLVPRLPALEAACLDYHRSRGNTHADWLATCRTWVRNEASGAFGARNGAGAASGGNAGKIHVGGGRWLTEAEFDAEVAAERAKWRTGEAH